MPDRDALELVDGADWDAWFASVDAWFDEHPGQALYSTTDQAARRELDELAAGFGVSPGLGDDPPTPGR